MPGLSCLTRPALAFPTSQSLLMIRQRLTASRLFLKVFSVILVLCVFFQHRSIPPIPSFFDSRLLFVSATGLFKRMDDLQQNGPSGFSTWRRCSIDLGPGSKCHIQGQTLSTGRVLFRSFACWQSSCPADRAYQSDLPRTTHAYSGPSRHIFPLLKNLTTFVLVLLLLAGWPAIHRKKAD